MSGAVSPSEWDGRVALVTGGAGSVGRRVVQSLAEAGATVVVNCFHSFDAAKELVADLTGRGLRAEVLRASVAKPDQVQRMIETIDERHGRLDLLVNNAASGTFVAFDDIADDDLDRAITTNVKGALWCTRAARPLLARARGCVVNVSSMGASHTPANYLPVGVSKAALEALTRYLAAELATDGIRVNAASAGLIDNEVGRMFPQFGSVSTNTVDATPLGRLATPDDLAAVVLMLGSPRSQWVTGQTLLADGGLSLLHRAMSPDPAPAPAPVAAEPPAPVPVLPPTGEDPIVVVGMGLALPGSSSPAEFWSQLMTGAELFVETPADRWPMDAFHDDDPAVPDKTYQSRSGFITSFEPHPALAAELSAVADIDFTELWLRHSIHQALDGVARRPDDRFSVAIGYTPDGSQHLQEALVHQELRARANGLGREWGGDLARDVEELAARSLPYRAPDAGPPVPRRIGQQSIAGILPADTKLTMVDTACSSSLYAIDVGVRELLSGRVDVAVCGGAFALAPGGAVLFSKLKGLSRAGAVRAFDRDADGVLFSDGAGMVVLKRLSRALADGDRVHGVLAGVGLSADGKGKAIYAPAAEGQRLAVDRAFRKSGIDPRDVDWVVAHATGTPAGDAAEFGALREAYAGSGPVWVTSNKSMIGHTGWAAGVISVIHVLLALEHGAIPAQQRFTSAPASFELETSCLDVPAVPQPWPARADGLRTAAVSGFGFGGTNAHVLLQEYRAGTPNQVGYGPRHDSRPVIVGWATRLPEDAGSFGPTYPAPPFTSLRLPPPTVRTTDRTQLMIVECMQQLDPAVRALCDKRRETVGVVVGHTGPTRNAVLYALRAYLDHLDTEAVALDRTLVGAMAGAATNGAATNGAAKLNGAALTTDWTLPGTASITALLATMRTEVQALLGPPTEDSFPGGMPNMIPARLCNYFDLRGLNITVDSAEASLTDAFDVAVSYLERGDIDVALVGGANGNSLDAWTATLPAEWRDADRRIAEGTFLFAVTRRDLAEAEGLPVLAEIETAGGKR